MAKKRSCTVPGTCYNHPCNIHAEIDHFGGIRLNYNKNVTFKQALKLGKWLVTAAEDEIDAERSVK